ncbi:alpha/beta fold hydrolase [Aestuariivirga sp.]|uniref:alpha/beta fold hydrolase n=1 Tax=Aestuariivirga sp. TaxID=2650926 RepID=UPI00391AFBDE
MGRVIEMPLPRLGETMEEGRIALIVKKPAEAFRRGETLLEVESDKTTVEVPALQDGILIEWLVASDQVVPVGAAIARIEIEGEAVGEARPTQVPVALAPAPAAEPRSAPFGTGSRARASTAARAEARRKGIDLSTLRGSGRNGRVTRADLAVTLRPARATYHVETPQGRIFYREWQAQGAEKGSALLLHGLFADSQSFTTLGRKLAARGYRTYAPDLPGHGETSSVATSPEEIARAIAASLPLAKLHVVGHSFGAVIAARLVQCALSLTLLSPAGCGEEINGDFIAAMLEGHIDHALGFMGESFSSEAQAALAMQLSTHGGELRSIAAAVAEDGRQTLSILSALEGAGIPVSAVFLRDDAVIPAHHALNLPFNVAVRMMPGVGHLPHWRAPDAIASLIGEK